MQGESTLSVREKEVILVMHAVRDGYVGPFDPDLDDEQPITVHMYLADWRRAVRLLYNYTAP